MKTVRFFKIALSVIIMGAAAMANAQEYKFGHLNSGNLLASMPETKAADEQLAALQQKLVAQGDSLVGVFRTAYDKYLKESSEGLLTPKQAKDRENALSKMQEDLQNYEQQIQQEILQKRQELLSPMLKKVDEAVHAVGKEGKYHMIFDESGGAMLFSLPSEDVSELVKKKLGL